MKQCAFLTLEQRGDFCIYDELLFEPLMQRGWAVQEIPWNRDGVDWSAFDAVIIRSTWDYQHHLEAFLARMASIEAVTPLLNSVAVCRWNCRKSYLIDLQARGIPIVPSHWSEQLTTAQLEEAFTAFDTNTLVVKPQVGANADDTFVLRADAPGQWSTALEVFREKALMLQPFLPQICDEGEYSLFYFGGEFSHAIRKQPAAGDFRVQEEHGGLISLCDVSADFKQQGARALAAWPETLLYARVDLVRDQRGMPMVMELELIEPSLYFDQYAQATEHFCEAFTTLVA